MTSKSYNAADLVVKFKDLANDVKTYTVEDMRQAARYARGFLEQQAQAMKDTVDYLQKVPPPKATTLPSVNFSTDVPSPSFEVRNFNCKIERVLEHVEDNTWFVDITFKVPERNTGQPIDISFNAAENVYQSEEERVSRLRRMCQRAMLHELDECIYVRGVRQFDPHSHEYPHFRVKYMDLTPKEPGDVG